MTWELLLAVTEKGFGRKSVGQERLQLASMIHSLVDQPFKILHPVQLSDLSGQIFQSRDGLNGFDFGFQFGRQKSTSFTCDGYECFLSSLKLAMLFTEKHSPVIPFFPQNFCCGTHGLFSFWKMFYSLFHFPGVYIGGGKQVFDKHIKQLAGLIRV